MLQRTKVFNRQKQELVMTSLYRGADGQEFESRAATLQVQRQGVRAPARSQLERLRRPLVRPSHKPLHHHRPVV